MLLICAKFIFAFGVFQIAKGQEAGGWDYETARGSLDPQHWYLKFEHCNGVRQSPVAVDCAHVHTDATLTPLTFVNYDKPIDNLLLHNDGHTIKIDVPADADMHIRSAGLPASYRLTQFHFHWGTTTKGGSEHKIFGWRWPLEMHLVHVDEDIPADQLTIDKNGMVVVSVLFDFPAWDGVRPMDAIDRLTTAIHQVIEEDQNITISNFVIGDLVPLDSNENYLRYGGSLTTPPCAEVVEWFILTRVMAVTPDILNRFRSTRQKIHSLQENTENDGNEVNISENDRPLQPLNERPIRLMGDLGDLPKCDPFPTPL